MPDALEDVLCRGEEASGALYEDRIRATSDETGYGGARLEGHRGEPTRLCAGQQSG